MLMKICPDLLGTAAAAYWIAPKGPVEPPSKWRSMLTCARVSPDEPPCAVKKSLDEARELGVIIFTMARPPKPDPKLRALKESGTANPQAQTVQDPAFVASDFFDPRDLVQVRYEMLRRVRTEGQSVAKATTLFGVSRPTFYKAQSAFDGGGLVGLLPAKRGPRGPHKITAEVLRFIAEAGANGEDLDAQGLVERIAQRFGLMVHRRTVERALARSKKKRQ